MSILLNVLMLIVGLGLGAFLFARIVEIRAGKPYSEVVEKRIRQQWQLFEDSTTLGIMSPFSETIQKMSPMFCQIYAEAAAAERGGLAQICGIGYGKALEFLIKDYAKLENPQAGSEIEQAYLSDCIKRYVKDPLLKDSTELATWLRNDETHYVRRHEGRSVSDLKNLIVVTVALIEESERRKLFSAGLRRLKENMGAQQGVSVND